MSNFQEMGETREPMAADCVQDALRIANLYEFVGSDFWICFAAKGHQADAHKIVQGWEVVWKRPPVAVPGMLVFHVDSKKKEMNLDRQRSLPYDVPLDEKELSTSSKDVTPELALAAQSAPQGSVLLA